MEETWERVSEVERLELYELPVQESDWSAGFVDYNICNGYVEVG